MWKPTKKQHLTNKQYVDESSGSGSGGGIAAVLNFVMANPATGEVIFDEDNSSDPAAFYDACEHKKPVMAFLDLDPFRHIDASDPSNMIFGGHYSEMILIFNAITKTATIENPT